MPQPSQTIPKYRRHLASGQAVVTIRGRDYYLGPWKSLASRTAYDRLIAEWLSRGRVLTVTQEALTIDDMIASHWTFAEQHYRKHGEATGELDNIRQAMRPLHRLYGDTEAAEFGPLKLKTIRDQMVRAGLSRRVINQRIGIIKRVFRWAVSEELVPPSVAQGLSTVNGLQRGRSAARETAPVQPVSDAVVDATLPHLPPVVQDLVQFQRLTGCRPGEACQLRPCDVDRGGDVWQYRPASHKTEHKELGRIILIGPQAQQLLEPYLSGEPTEYCFSPRRSEKIRLQAMRARRKTKVQPSQRDRSRPNPRRKATNRYSTASYLYAIYRACDRAKVERWSPNQLRHLAATKLRATFGLEAAQAVLGHAKADVTQIYAARDLARAASAIAQVG